MTNNNPVVFDPQNQWAKELGASFIGSMAVIYFRDHWYSPQLDYLKREEAIQNCKDYCCLMRSMGYVHLWAVRATMTSHKRLLYVMCR